MALPARVPATYVDILQLPDNVIGEIVSGDLTASPRPAPRHALVSFGLSAVLGSRFQFDDGGPGGWLFLYEPELHFGNDVLVPDLAGWRRERMPELPEEAHITLVPDWVCEILSPSTARFDRVQKLPVYAREGAQYLWLIDPIARTLEAFTLDLGRWVLLGTYGGNESVNIEPFDAVPLALQRLWGER